jgi:rhodanese-related sulfurtransferase
MAGKEIQSERGEQMKQITWKQAGVILLISLGLILAFSPIQSSNVSLSETQQLARDINDRVDHITADQLGQMIIDKDPGFIIIDTRPANEYTSYHIPGAINYPSESLFNTETLAELDREKILVLYSAGGTHAAQMWVLLRQLGFDNTVVLLGGLNYWVEVYSNPEAPKDVDAESEYFMYQFRVSAGKHLLGETELQAQPKKEPIKVQPLDKKKMKQKKGDEGC